MFEAIAERRLRVVFPILTVHRLEKEMLELEVCKLFRLCSRLRKDKLEFAAVLEHEFRPGLRAIRLKALIGGFRWIEERKTGGSV